MHNLDDRAAGGAFCIFRCVESHAMECHAIDRLLIPGPICHEIKPLDLSCNGIQRTHSSKPFLALGCQCCQHHHTAFLALDLAEDSLRILFEVIDALAHMAVRLGVVECASI